MAKSQLRLKARELRRKGFSQKDIAKHLKISRSSASFWTREIILTADQTERLKRSELKGKELGRFKSARIKREKRLLYVDNLKKLGRLLISKINTQELFIAGTALYWAEGGKSDRNRRVEFCNSDPRMIKFLILW